MPKKRDLLSITDLSSQELLGILSVAKKMKVELKKTGKNSPVLSRKTLIMVFEKPSLRTHASFEIGMTQLGGSALYFGPEQIGLGKREPVEHASKVLSSMGDMIMARVFAHKTVSELAMYSKVPVINGLSDLEHPCQILADLLTVLEQKRSFKRLKVAFIGDGENNVTHSLALACGMLGMHFMVASPKGYAMKAEIVGRATDLATKSRGSISQTRNPKDAVRDADVVYTDTWVSMGDETSKSLRLKAFRPYQVSAALMRLAKPTAIFMHDMPAYLGSEVTKEVFDSPQSVVYQQAENRLHAQKALLVFLARSQNVR
jgi:ornithine carbamoyltransferase